MQQAHSHETTGLLAVLATIVGVAVGANPTPLVLDILRDGSVTGLAESAQPALATADA